MKIIQQNEKSKGYWAPLLVRNTKQRKGTGTMSKKSTTSETCRHDHTELSLPNSTAKLWQVDSLHRLLKLPTHEQIYVCFIQQEQEYKR